jgi:hypothetical protein
MARAFAREVATVGTPHAKTVGVSLLELDVEHFFLPITTCQHPRTQRSEKMRTRGCSFSRRFD